MTQNQRSTHLAGVIGGALALCVYFTCLLISMTFFPPPFSPLNHMISDLGNSSLNPLGAAWFNVGNVLTGLGLVPFFIGFNIWQTEQKGQRIRVKLLQIVGFVLAFAVIMIGIFSEDYYAAHVFWARMFFGADLVVMILSFLTFRRHPRFSKGISVYCLLATAMNIINAFPFGETPIVEWFAVFSAIGLVLLMIINTFLAFRKTGGVPPRLV